MIPALIRIETGLRTTTLPRLAAGLGVAMQDDPTPPAVGRLDLTAREKADVDAARRLLRRWPVDARCLRRSLLIGHALRARRPVLGIGVARHGGEIHAHAWVAVDGIAIEEPSVEFVPLRRSRAPRA